FFTTVNSPDFSSLAANTGTASEAERAPAIRVRNRSGGKLGSGLGPGGDGLKLNRACWSTVHLLDLVRFVQGNS
ncbi:MAG: hypothetical protein EBS97_04885, partial [Verrucomicrobia bacterium]|nr:hypothetical protein [Verrucomicrobiota bacterium]